MISKGDRTNRKCKVLAISLQIIMIKADFLSDITECKFVKVVAINGKLD